MDFEFVYFSFFAFGIDMINTFTHFVVPSKTIPDSRSKWAKCIPVFRPARRKNDTRWGGKYPYRLCKGVFPLRALGGLRRANNWPIIVYSSYPGRANVSYISLLNLVNHFREYKRVLKLTFLFPRTTFV